MVLQMSKAKNRMEKLEEQRARITAELQRIRAREEKKKRAEETRRKLLIGAMIMAQVERGERPEGGLRAELDAHLTRESDRELFGLEPRPKSEQREA